MLRKEKEKVVEDLRQKLASSGSFILTDFSGINVKDMTELRKTFRAAQIECLVAKNTLIRRAVKDTPFETGLDKFLNGPTAIIISQDEGVGAAKIVRKYADESQKLQIKAGVMSERVIDSAQVKEIASLPSKEVLLARLLGTLNQPVTGFVYVLNDMIGRAVRVLDQVRQAKEAQPSE
ncbi:50S ribosomal protein L10 [bacterium]|nr:50S ribosomal protein L10 [bacterium]